jgi:hypothetical protein
VRFSVIEQHGYSMLTVQGNGWAHPALVQALGERCQHGPITISVDDFSWESEPHASATISFKMREAVVRKDYEALCAAAPDLLMALKEANDFICAYFGPVASDDAAGWSDGDAEAVARLAEGKIAKAEGR